MSQVSLYSTLLEHSLRRRDAGARVEADGLAERDYMYAQPTDFLSKANHYPT